MVQVVPGKIRTHHDAVGADVQNHLSELLIARAVATVGPFDDLAAVEVGVGISLGNIKCLVPAASAQMGDNDTELRKRLQHPCKGARLSESLAVPVGPRVGDDRNPEFLADLVGRPEALVGHVKSLKGTV